MTIEHDKAIPFWRRITRRRATTAMAVLIGLGAAFGAYRYWGGAAKQASADASGRAAFANRPLPVSVAEVGSTDLRLWASAIGTATPRNLITLHSRVDGELLRLAFIEGEVVKQGQLLAELDPRPFQALLTQANGQLAKDKALLENARLDLARYTDLWSKDSISRQQLDTQIALVSQYEGSVENDRGVVKNAKLQLSYTRITAPITGRIGLRQVDPGNQVHAADTNGLASIAQIEPMTVIFSLPENLLPEIMRRQGSGLVAEAWDRELKNKLAVGRLLTTDNQIDPTTGTIKLKAEFANADHALFPNQFSNIRLLLGIRKDAIAVPSAAVLRGASGTFLYAVDADGVVKTVPVTTGAVDGDLIEVTGAIKAGDHVVTDGGDKLRDGAKVEVIAADRNAKGPAGEQKQGKHRGEGRPAGGWHKRDDAPAKPGEAPAQGQRPGS